MEQSASQNSTSLNPSKLLKPIKLSDMTRLTVQDRSVVNKIRTRHRGLIPETSVDASKLVVIKNGATGETSTKLVNKRGRKSIQKRKKRQLELNHTNFLSLYKDLRNQSVEVTKELPVMIQELKELEDQYDRELSTPRMVGKEEVFMTTQGLYSKILDLKEKIAIAKNNTPDNFTLSTSHHLQDYFEELDKMNVVNISTLNKDQEVPSKCLVKIIVPRKTVTAADFSIESPVLSTIPTTTSCGDEEFDDDDNSLTEESPVQDDMIFEDEDEDENGDGEQGILLDITENYRKFYYVFFVILDDENPRIVDQAPEVTEVSVSITIDQIKKSISSYLPSSMVSKLPKQFYLLGQDGRMYSKKLKLLDCCSKADHGFDITQPLLIVISPQPALNRIIIQYDQDTTNGFSTEALFRKKLKGNKLGSIMNAMLKEVKNEKIDTHQALESIEHDTLYCPKCIPRQCFQRDSCRGELVCPKCGFTKNDMDNTKSNITYGEHHIKTSSNTDAKIRNFLAILTEFQVFFLIFIYQK